MIQLLVILVLIGILLYFLNQLPVDPWMRTVIRVVAIICVIFYLLTAFGLLNLDVPVPRFGAEPAPWPPWKG